MSLWPILLRRNSETVKKVCNPVTMLVYARHTVVVVLFSLALLLVSRVLGRRLYYSKNKSTPFECGFDPKDSARLPFSIRFFFLAVVFLIFDIEVVLLFPLILGLKAGVCQVSSIAGLVFLFILLGGLLHE